MIHKLIRTAATLSLLGSLFSIARPFAAQWTNILISSAKPEHLGEATRAVSPLGRYTCLIVRHMIPVVHQGEKSNIPHAISQIVQGLRQSRYNDHSPERKEIR